MVQAQRDWFLIFGHVLLHDAIVDRNLRSFEMLQGVKDGVSSCTGGGTIQINGITKPLTMEVKITQTGDKLTVEGHTPLKMTSFGIKPPSPKLPTGNIVTKDEVKISFSWVTVK